jgi:hypothetical protein
LCDGEKDRLPNPDDDWNAFVKAVGDASSRIPMTYDFLKKKDVTWIKAKYILKPGTRRSASSGGEMNDRKCAIM